MQKIIFLKKILIAELDWNSGIKSRAASEVSLNYEHVKRLVFVEIHLIIVTHVIESIRSFTKDSYFVLFMCVPH